MGTFVRVTEVWVPTRDRTKLEWAAGLYGGLEAFRALSERVRFEYDEGLPGKAWSRRKPVVLGSFENSYFRRTEAARAAGLSTGIAWPIFAGDFLTSVVVFLCANDADLMGAIELWEESAEHPGDLVLAEGFYGSASKFEWISRQASFRAGHGLPGSVWATGMPQIVADLGRSEHFLRADAALRAGIDRGLGLPCCIREGRCDVITFLSAMETPIAHRFEIWLPDADRTKLVLDAGHCDLDPDYGSTRERACVDVDGGPLGLPLRTGIPAVVDDLEDQTEGPLAQARSAGMRSMMALPVLGDGALQAVVALYF